ncbi:putative Carboxylesterase type B domain-containing protein [Seiridium unicorne]|uniref:Carboxylesterase type B domain-containing protein n=1 Tax=Seiridium unicorne TaxID=138068 RepID=A0ABR2UGG5_9PEZI
MKALNSPSESKLPVIVWLTDGTFLVGGSTIPYRVPTHWIESDQRQIVVSANCRITIFGFPNAAGLDPQEQNLGLLDQRLGLEWCPDMPRVRNQIMPSGPTLPDLPVPAPNHQHFSFVTQSLGFEGNNSADELEFTRQQPAEDLIGFIKEHTLAGNEPVLSFRPIVDNRGIFGYYEERATSGNFSKLPTATMARHRGLHALVFRFLLNPSGNCSFPNISPGPWERVYHGSDLPLIFGTYSWYRGPSTHLEKMLSKAWQELYLAFAEEGPEGIPKFG